MPRVQRVTLPKGGVTLAFAHSVSEPRLSFVLLSRDGARLVGAESVPTPGPASSAAGSHLRRQSPPAFEAAGFRTGRAAPRAWDRARVLVPRHPSDTAAVLVTCLRTPRSCRARSQKTGLANAAPCREGSSAPTASRARRKKSIEDSTDQPLLEFQAGQDSIKHELRLSV